LPWGLTPSDVAPWMGGELGIQQRLGPDWLISESLGVLWRPSLPEQAPLTPEVQVSTTVVAAVLAPCLHRQVVFGWVFGCTGLELGQLAFYGTRMGAPPATASAFWGAFEPRGGVDVALRSLPLPRFAQLAFRVSASLAVPLFPAQLSVFSTHQGSTTQWKTSPETAPVSGAIGAGFVVFLGL
jgi:hypothetical protein